MKYKELEAKIKEIGLGTVAEEDFNVKDIDPSFKKSDLKKVYESEQYDGHECEVVFQHEDFFVKIEGYYSSYEGTEWDAISRCKPKEVTQTIYENV